MKRNIAIILAGGVGTRLGMSTPKQFFKVAGKMVVEHTVDVFERNPRIDEIAIVSNPALINDFENIVLRNKWRKVKKILKGGKERYDSSLSAIRAYEKEDVNLMPLTPPSRLPTRLLRWRTTSSATSPTARACVADRLRRLSTLPSSRRLTTRH